MIRGNSGCNIEFTDGKVIKSGPRYSADRLRKQVQKQQLFHSLNFEDIEVPEVFCEYTVDSVFHFEMQYYNATDMIYFLNTQSIDRIYWFLETMIEFISTNINRSKLQCVSTDSIISKYDSVRIDDRFDRLFYDLPVSILMPIGMCHGDLTLSNILYTHNKFILVDFLDSFIDTPLIDIAKLRQDTKLHWSLLLYEQEYNKCRLQTALDYLDKRLAKTFERYRIVHLLEILNVLRLIPYCTTNQLKQQALELLCQL